MACYVAARPCKQEYDLRRGGQNFHFSLPLTDISIIRYVAKLHCRSAPFCKQYPGPFLASPIINFCSRLSACCICPPSCAVLHVEASCRKLQPSTAPRREGLICSPVDGSVWHRQQQQPIQQDWQPSSLLPSSPFYQLIPWQNSSNSMCVINCQQINIPAVVPFLAGQSFFSISFLYVSIT